MAKRRGSVISDKMFLLAMRDMVPVKAVGSDWSLRGWVVGLDDYHIRLLWVMRFGAHPHPVVERCVSSLIHKTALERIDFIEREPSVHPFRAAENEEEGMTILGVAKAWAEGQLSGAAI